MNSPSNGLWTSDSFPDWPEVDRHEIASTEDAEDVVQVQDGSQAGARGPTEDELLRGDIVLGEHRFHHLEKLPHYEVQQIFSTW